ncbi:MAG TPA: hypothetical protein VMH90_00155 [Thermoplasmata archaeon]|nr:hypothetical protein [Thermoplasmata archaeon]
MSTCRDTLAFLDNLRSKSAGASLPATDLDYLVKLGLVQLVDAPAYAQLAQDVQGLGSARDAILKDGAQRARISADLLTQSHRTHSILFKLEGAEHRAADEAAEARDADALRAVDADLQQREQTFAQLAAKRTLLDALTPFGSGYAALTGLGAVALRDLGVALYRVDDTEFSAYWAEAQRVDQELDALANQSAGYMSGLAAALPGAGGSNLWAVAVGLAKLAGDPRTKVPMYVDAYNQVGRFAGNPENRLMAAEILCSVPTPLAPNLGALAELLQAVRSAGVPPDAALGVAAILLMGRRADGTYATGNLTAYLRVTRSFESAALLAVVNAPFDDLTGKFERARQVLLGWGYELSEDVELASAYLTVSDLPIDGVGPKLAIVARGLTTYLRYPLVGAAILTEIPGLEANETLGLLEKAYETIGRRTGPMAPPELICLAIRMLHGIQVAAPSDLDATAAEVPAAPGAVPPYAGAPRFGFVPLFVAHGFYYSTFSGVGGAHPGHVHAWGGFSG